MDVSLLVPNTSIQFISQHGLSEDKSISGR
jgi:hypothetical protein